MWYITTQQVDYKLGPAPSPDVFVTQSTIIRPSVDKELYRGHDVTHAPNRSEDGEPQETLPAGHANASTGFLEEEFFGAFQYATKKVRPPKDLPLSTVISGYGDACIQQVVSRAECCACRQPPVVPPQSSFAGPFSLLGDLKEKEQLHAVTLQVLQALSLHNLSVELWYMAGRRPYLNITHHYLRHTVRRFGGVAQRVMWLHTEDQPYVPEFVRTHYGRKVPRNCLWCEHMPEFVPLQRGNIRRMYRRALSCPRTIIVKIDDDTVYIHPGSVTYLVAELLGLQHQARFAALCCCERECCQPCRAESGARILRSAAVPIK